MASSHHSHFSRNISAKIKSSDSLEDLELVRSSFEELWNVQVSEHREDTLARQRQRRELELLRSLLDSDDSIDPLIVLWSSEPDGAGSISLNLDVNGMSRPQIASEERQLRCIAEAHPDWTEPYIRLSAILFIQDRIYESYEYALKALDLKPWHFAIPHLFICLSIAQGNFGQALYWGRMKLPRLSRSRSQRRRAWVDRALQQALDRLELEEASPVHLADHNVWQ